MVADCLQSGLSMVVGCHRAVLSMVGGYPWGRVVSGRVVTRGRLSLVAGCLVVLGCHVPPPI